MRHEEREKADIVTRITIVKMILLKSRFAISPNEIQFTLIRRRVHLETGAFLFQEMRSDIGIILV